MGVTAFPGRGCFPKAFLMGVALLPFRKARLMGVVHVLGHVSTEPRVDG